MGQKQHQTHSSTPKPISLRVLRGQIQRAEAEFALEQAQYATRLLASLQEQTSNVVIDTDAGRWTKLSEEGSLVTSKDLEGRLQDRTASRRQCYKAWRLDPHARGALRHFQKFIIGRGVTFDFADRRRGVWSDPERPVDIRDDPREEFAVKLVWDEFDRRNGFRGRAKELVLRVLRDGEMFLRRFSGPGVGELSVRFVEPDSVQSSVGKTTGSVTVSGDPLKRERKTEIKEGVEVLQEDVETVIAYWIKMSGDADARRVPAEEVLHLKCLTDTNDTRGIPLLEPVLKKFTNYEQWEEYRLILNKVRTAIALVRKVEGTSAQAQSLIQGRLPARTAPEGREPQTTAGQREAGFRPGTILTPGPGVSYEFLSPGLDARDAAQDGRNILLSIASGLGIPEMLVTGDWSNANYASSVEARSPAVREWEDWQEFFTPALERVAQWVIDEAVRGKILPSDTDRKVTVRWPPIVHKDETQQTQRLATLNAAGLLSKTTWAAVEGFVWDDELENLRDEGELLPSSEVENEFLPGMEARAQRAHRALLALRELEQTYQTLDPTSPYRELMERTITYTRESLGFSAKPGAEA